MSRPKTSGVKKKLTSTGWLFIIMGIAFLVVGILVTFSGVAGVVGVGKYGGSGSTYEVAEGPFAHLYGLVIVGLGVYCFFKAFGESRKEQKEERPKFTFKTK